MSLNRCQFFTSAAAAAAPPLTSPASVWSRACPHPQPSITETDTEGDGPTGAGGLRGGSVGGRKSHKQDLDTTPPSPAKREECSRHGGGKGC